MHRTVEDLLHVGAVYVVALVDAIDQDLIPVLGDADLVEQRDGFARQVQAGKLGGGNQIRAIAFGDRQQAELLKDGRKVQYHPVVLHAGILQDVVQSSQVQ